MRGYIFPKLLKVDKSDGIINNVENLICNNEESCYIFKASNKKSPVIKMKFERKVSGYLFVEVEEGSKDSLLIEYGPTEKSIFFKKKLNLSQEKVVIIDDELLSMEYLKISLVSDCPVPTDAFAKIKKIGLRFAAYPYNYVGDFKCENNLLNEIWYTGAYTTQMCVHDSKKSSSSYDILPKSNREFIDNWTNPYSKYVIFDGPRRDREAWIGDIRTEALTILTAFGDDKAIKSSLQLFYDLQWNSGLIPGSGASWQNYLEYNLWWVITIWEHFLYTGDREFLGKIYPGVRLLEDYLYFAIDERKFLKSDASWLWTFPRVGYISSIQCVLYEALNCIGKIESEFGNDLETEKLEIVRKELKNNINKEFWNEEKGVYVDDFNFDTEITPVLSDVNCFAVIFGVADADKAKRITKYLKEKMWTDYGSTTLDYKMDKASLRPETKGFLSDMIRQSDDPDKELIDMMWPHNKQIWPFMNGYEVEANLLLGNIEDAFELIDKCWGNMTRKGATTYWEMVNAEDGEFAAVNFQKHAKSDCMNSACHGWSGWVSYLMQTYILGVKPIAAGFKEVMIKPNIGDLTDVHGKVPTPFGIVKVKIQNIENEIEVIVNKPKEVKVIFDDSYLKRYNKNIQFVEI